MAVNKEHYAKTLQDLTTKSQALAKNLAGMVAGGGSCCKLNNYMKFTKELNQATNQDCIKALAFN
jgi:flagellar biosynthesis chaperone FliJ